MARREASKGAQPQGNEGGDRCSITQSNSPVPNGKTSTKDRKRERTIGQYSSLIAQPRHRRWSTRRCRSNLTGYLLRVWLFSHKPLTIIRSFSCCDRHRCSRQRQQLRRRSGCCRRGCGWRGCRCGRSSCWGGCIGLYVPSIWLRMEGLAIQNMSGFRNAGSGAD